jgi:integrase
VPKLRPRTLEETIEEFSAASMDPAATVFARQVAKAAQPRSVNRAKAFLFAAAKLAHFAVSIGTEPRIEILYDEALVERFILCGTDTMSPATRRTLRTNLRALSRTLAPRPLATSLPRGRAKSPYSQSEIDAYLALAAAQPTLARRRRTVGFIALAAGAGLTGADLRGVRGIDVVERSGGLVVEVGGHKPRVVPVLARYHEPLLESAAFIGEDIVVGGDDPWRRNVTGPLLSSLAGGMDLERIDAGRLRANWLLHCADAIGLSSLMSVAGFTTSQQLNEIALLVPPKSEVEIVALLGGGIE